MIFTPLPQPTLVNMQTLFNKRLNQHGANNCHAIDRCPGGARQRQPQRQMDL
jgi:hypothetical protein